MVFLFRVVLGLTLALGSIIGLVYSQPKWMADLGLDLWVLPEVNKKMADNIQRNSVLEQKKQKTWETAKYKTQVLQDLIQNKLSLPEAADRILQVTSKENIFLATHEFKLEKNSLRWRTYRLLIHWAKFQFEEDPGQAADVGSRLEEELMQLLCKQD